jgi:hypothetical protein
MRWKSVFSFYGSKSKITQYYPEPKHDLVIEPFAGGGSYSFRHARLDSGRTAWLNDLDERTASIWEFLLSPDAADWVARYWPASVRTGDLITDLFPASAPSGLLELGMSEANQGTQGAKGVHRQVTSMGEKCWSRTRDKLLEIIPLISHWRFTKRDYAQLSNIEATWFIDPPYNNVAGNRYRTGSGLDYGSLATWCRSRSGQVIVCEQSGADWLPFTDLATSARGIKSRYQRADAGEAVWIGGSGETTDPISLPTPGG